MKTRSKFINPLMTTTAGEILNDNPTKPKRIIAILHEDYIEELETPIRKVCSKYIKTK